MWQGHRVYTNVALFQVWHLSSQHQHVTTEYLSIVKRIDGVLLSKTIYIYPENIT